MKLKEKLLSLDLVVDNEYLDKYCELIESNRDTKREKFKTQRHHIIPKYYFKYNNLEVDNSKENIVNLLYKDHILAHYYLCMCSISDRTLYQNFISIRHITGNKNTNLQELYTFIINELDNYQFLYERSRKIQGNLERGKVIKPATQERKNKISKANSGGIYVYKNIENKCILKHIKEEELDIYLKDGWLKGNPILSKVHKGKPSWNKGVPSNRKGVPNIGCSLNTPVKIKVYCYETNKVYASLSEAGRELNLKYSRISKWCKYYEKTGILKTYKNYTFRYVRGENDGCKNN